MSNASPSLIPPQEPRGFSRLFPMERRSLRKTIADSGLSKEAQEIIRKVLRRSRLWRFEKIEVAQELISHFLDGELAGKSYSQLVASFGDPDLTAKLIRRSKIRNRPIMMKIAQLFGWVFFAVAAAYLSMWSYYHAGVPTPRVDFLPEFNRFAAELPQEDRAWNVYRPVWTKFQFCEGGEFWKQTDVLYKQVGEDGERYNRQLRPTDPEWDGAVAKLSEIQELLDSFREGSRIERLGFEFQADPNLYSDADFACLFPHLDRADADQATWLRNHDDMEPEVRELLKNSVLGIVLPHVQPMRTAGRLLTIDSHWAIEQGDTDRVVDNIRAMYGLGRHAADTNMLVGSLVGFAIVGQAFELIEELIPVHIDEFTDEQLEQIQDFTAQARLDDFLGDLSGERALMLDLIQRMFTDNGKGDGRITPQGLEMLQFATGSRQESWMEIYPEFPTVMMVAENLAAPASLFVMASRKETIRKYEECMDLFQRDQQLPYWEAEHYDLLGEDAKRYRVLSGLLPAHPQIRRAKDRKIGRQEGVIAAIASHRFFKANGEWPESLVQLVPDFVVELPFDVVTGEPLNLIANDDGVTIYSVGNDHEDDGGELPTMIYTNTAGEVFHYSQRSRGYMLSPHADSSTEDGDWILWPKQEEEKFSRKIELKAN